MLNLSIDQAELQSDLYDWIKHQTTKAALQRLREIIQMAERNKDMALLRQCLIFKQTLLSPEGNA